MSGYQFFSDIDECMVDNQCAQICTNTMGSFTCSCEDGFQLDENGLDCNGKKLSGRGTTYICRVPPPSTKEGDSHNDKIKLMS